MTFKESIIIHNLGALKSVEIKEIKPLTVLIGDSGSGKSTLMKAIALMRYIYKRLNIRFYLKSSNISGKLFYIKINDLLKDGFGELFTRDTSISYTITVNGREYTITYDGSTNLSNPKSIEPSDLMFFKESWVSELRNVIPTWENNQFSAKSASLGFYFNETYNDFVEATENLKNIDLDYLNMKLSVSKAGNGRRKLILSTNDNYYSPIDFKNASSGMLTTIPLVVLAKYFSKEFSFKKAMQKSIINLLFEKDLTEKYHPQMELSSMPCIVHMHVEEPELSLDPYTQLRLMDTIISQTLCDYNSDRRVEVIFATHSPYIANFLNVLLRRDENAPHIKADDLEVLLVADGKVQTLIATDENTKEKVVDTTELSEPIESIFNEYMKLER